MYLWCEVSWYLLQALQHTHFHISTICMNIFRSQLKREMMIGSLSWQLHYVRTYLANVSTRCSSPPHLSQRITRASSRNVGKISSSCTKWSCKERELFIISCPREQLRNLHTHQGKRFMQKVGYPGISHRKLKFPLKLYWFNFVVYFLFSHGTGIKSPLLVTEDSLLLATAKKSEKRITTITELVVVSSVCSTCTCTCTVHQRFLWPHAVTHTTFYLKVL